MVTPNGAAIPFFCAFMVQGGDYMKKTEQIKALERELGRYRKKVGDQNKEINALRDQIALYNKGLAEEHASVDALLAQVALKYGTDILDEDTGDKLGNRLELPLYSIEETKKKYEVQARRDLDCYYVGVVPRE